jgi:hypothetical protein
LRKAIVYQRQNDQYIPGVVLEGDEEVKGLDSD